MSRFLEEYEQREQQSIISRLKNAVTIGTRQAVDEATANCGDKPIHVTVNVQINYASGGGATVNVR